MNKNTKKIVRTVATIAVFSVLCFLAAGFTFARLNPSILADVEAAAKAAEEALTAGEVPELLEGVQLVSGVSEVSATPSGRVISHLTVEGLEGPIEMQVALNPDGTVAAINVLNNSETPDVGGLALQSAYLDNYIGVSDPETVDAYTGATVTSTAVKTGVSLAMTQLDVLNGAAYEAPVELTAEEILENYLVEFLGESYEDLHADSRKIGTCELNAVYASDAGYGMYVEGLGHDENSPIKLLVCMAPDGTVENIKVIEHHETEGFGAKALQDNYLVLYQGGKAFTNSTLMDGIYIPPCPDASETSEAVYFMVSLCTLTYNSLSAAAAE